MGEVISTINMCIQSVENQILSIQHSHEQYTEQDVSIRGDNNDFKTLNESITKVKSDKSTFNLPIPDHANDWMEVIEEGGFSLEDEDEDEKEIINNKNYNESQDYQMPNIEHT